MTVSFRIFLSIIQTRVHDLKCFQDVASEGRARRWVCYLRVAVQGKVLP
jgi:hypothetical protein